VRIARPLLRGRFVRRFKRFFADVVLDDGREATVHCPNSGSMTGIAVEGAPVLVSDSEDPARKLRLTLERVRIGRAWVGVNTMLPNRIVREAIEQGNVPSLAGTGDVRSEVVCGPGSRIDFRIDGADGRRTWVEVKNTTLRVGSAALFPDAVTERGRKHLHELERLADAGDRAVMFFVVNRTDCAEMGPADAIDPEYGAALRRAASRGVELLAWRVAFRGASVRLDRPLPIRL
jgi:sugar fermentation stimulation protein A